jgi:hypothetical protein
VYFKYLKITSIWVLLSLSLFYSIAKVEEKSAGAKIEMSNQ